MNGFKDAAKLKAQRICEQKRGQQLAQAHRSATDLCNALRSPPAAMGSHTGIKRVLREVAADAATYNRVAILSDGLETLDPTEVKAVMPPKLVTLVLVNSRAEGEPSEQTMTEWKAVPGLRVVAYPALGAPGFWRADANSAVAQHNTGANCAQ
jgi:hypothetical protein